MKNLKQRYQRLGEDIYLLMQIERITPAIMMIALKRYGLVIFQLGMIIQKENFTM